jgi:membrane peptidoglycan carboxypeptidase
MVWPLRFLRGVLALLLIAVSLGALGVLFVVLSVERDLPKLPDHLSDLDPPRQMICMDRNGQELFRVGKTMPVPFDRISPLFIQALRAVEDESFFEHHGISKRALVRIALGRLFGGGGGGGSTLTQQLVKNTFLTFDQTVDRKLREMLLAVQLEERYSKEDILQAYCNTVNFGAGCLGIETAAQEYFGKPAIEMDLLESATLAGVLNAPSRFHPRLQPERCMKRRNWVLTRMVHAGLVDSKRADELMSQAVLVLPEERSKYGHLKDEILSRLRQLCVEKGFDASSISYAGLVVHTSIDGTLQDLAQSEVNRQSLDLKVRLGKNGSTLDAAFVALDPRRGGVLALVGGHNYSYSQFNCATQGLRQPGSAYKPAFYYSALRLGHHPLEVVLDSLESHDLGYGQTWRPHNWNQQQQGPLTLVYALMQSLNIPTARLAVELGTHEMASTLRLAGISAEQDPVPSLALGSGVVRPIELAGLYATFANGGQRAESFLISRVENSYGELLFRKHTQVSFVLEPLESYLVVDLLKGAVQHGTGRALRSLSLQSELGGKTGTTNDYRDSWFCSVMPNVVTVSWMGNLNNTPMRFNSRSGVTGAGGALQITKALLPEIDRICGDGRRFSQPEGIVFEKVDLRTGSESEDGARVALRKIDL